MRRHKLALCAVHYVEWLPQQVERTISKYSMFTRDDKVLVAVSGGKDSLALWDMLLGLGYHAEGLYIGLGIDDGFGYSDLSLKKVKGFARTRPGAVLHVIDIAETYGESIPQVAARKQRGRGKPCAVCGLIKRYVMNRVASQGGFDALATGHNLDDEVAVLFGNTLYWQTDYLVRQAPVLEERDSLARKVKPLCRLYEREVVAYAIIKGIDYIYEECPHAVGSTTNRYKKLLNQLDFDSPGAKLQFYLTFLKAKEQGFFQQTTEQVPLHPCEKCGQPTTAPEVCTFCRLWRSAPPKTPQPQHLSENNFGI
jgi:uncharacterized protein (TIGR00269 family)